MRRIAVPLQPHIEKRQTRLMPWQPHIGSSFLRAQLSELAVAFGLTGGWWSLQKTQHCAHLLPEQPDLE